MEEIVLGDLTPTRDFNYIEDTCRGFIAIAKCDEAIGHIINIGSNYEISIKDTLNIIKDLMHSNVTFVTDKERLRPKNSEVLRLWCDNSKIHKMTGFTPKINISEGLQKTVDWFTNPGNLKKYKTDIYNV